VPPSSAAAVTPGGITRLSALLDLTSVQINDLWRQLQPRAAHPQADADDLRAGGLIALWRRDHTSAARLIERSLAVQLDAYGAYAHALIRLSGRRPRALDDFAAAEAVQSALIDALTHDQHLSAAAALYHFLIVDYYLINGLRTRGLTAEQCRVLALNGHIDRAELVALTTLCDGIIEIDWIRALTR
jgi:hypothetical protein